LPGACWRALDDRPETTLEKEKFALGQTPPLVVEFIREGICLWFKEIKAGCARPTRGPAGEKTEKKNEPNQQPIILKITG